MTPRRLPEHVAGGIHRLVLGRGAPASNVYFVESGSSWVLVDAGWATSASLIRAAAQTLFGSSAHPTGIVLTHIHPDHSGAAGELARSWKAPVWVHPGELPMAAGRYLPEYGMPLDRLVVAPLMRLLPSTTRDRITAHNDITDVARPFDPEEGVPGLPAWPFTERAAPALLAFAATLGPT